MNRNFNLPPGVTAGDCEGGEEVCRSCNEPCDDLDDRGECEACRVERLQVRNVIDPRDLSE